MEQKGLKGGTKSYGCATGGGGVGRLPPGYGHASIQKCSWGEPQTPPPPGGVPRVSIAPPPELAPPFGAPLVLGQKSTSKKKRERGALDSAAFKLAPIQAGRAPPPRLAPMPPPCTPPPLPKGVARGVSRLPGTPPPPHTHTNYTSRPNWVKPRGERFGGQSTVVGPPPPPPPPLETPPNSVLPTPLLPPPLGTPLPPPPMAGHRHTFLS